VHVLAGYSGTPLAKKLGFREGSRVRISSAPENYLALVSPRPKSVHISKALRENIDIWHFFARSSAELSKQLPKLLMAIRADGMIWVSWPKKASKVPTDLTEDVIRKVALPLGLVDVKVCAVDDTWSGLKLVIRKELRR
jgi:hypothetical protein